MRGKGSTIVTIAISLFLVLGVLSPVCHSASEEEENTGTPSGWTDDINLSNNSTTGDIDPRIILNGSNAHIVWSKQMLGHTETFYINSTDAGQNWNNPVQVSEGAPGIHCITPDIGIDGNYLHVVWDDNDAIGFHEIRYCNSTDGGIIWGDSKMISSDDGETSERPVIIVNGSEINVLWVDHRHGSESFPPNTELYYVRSLDSGITWDDGLGNVGQERRITNALYESCGQGIAVEGGTLHLLWGDTRNGVTTGDIYYKRSLDKGVTWDDGLGNINQDRRLTDNTTNHLAFGTIGVYGTIIHAVWVDVVGSSYYLYYRNSTDNGANWNPIQLLVGSGTAYNPSIDVIGNEVHLTWDDWRDTGSTKEIYYKNSTDSGATWGSEVRLTAVDDNSSAGPKIALSGNYRHITWIDQRDGNPEIYYKRSPDFPTDTTPPNHTNETPPPDSYKDAPGTNISVHVTDPSGVNQTTIQLYVNGSLVAHSLTPIPDGYNVSYESPGFEPGVVECRIIADDNLSNTLDYTWNFTVLAIYDIPLQEGWNLISVPHVQVDTAIDEVLRDIDGKWDCIQAYDTLGDYWKTNATFKPDQLNDLKTLNYKMGFWINITESSVNLTVRGHIPISTSIPLYAGWNLVGYPSMSIDTVANALWGTGADRVEVFDPAEPYRIREVGPSYVMKPGEGYWVHVPADTTWIIDW